MTIHSIIAAGSESKIHAEFERLEEQIGRKLLYKLDKLFNDFDSLILDLEDELELLLQNTN